MSNSSVATNKQNWFAIMFVILFALLFVFAIAGLQKADTANYQLRVERAQAWEVLTQTSTDPSQREVLMFLSSRIPGCLVSNHVRPDLKLDPNFTYNPEAYKAQRRTKLLAHEQLCLETVRGEMLASTPQGRDLMTQVVVPQ